MKITLAITGASGTIYAHRLLQYLINSEQVTAIYLVMSDSAKLVAEHELPEVSFVDYVVSGGKVELLDNNDFFTPIASGSNSADAMVILPASMGSVGRIAGGISGDLIARAADVMLKEGKQIIICPRETPFSLIHLRNLTTLKESGATILPTVPSFYSHPTTIDELVDTVIERILNQLGIDNKGFKWRHPSLR